MGHGKSEVFCLQGNDIWLFAEQRYGRVLNVALELTSKAREMASNRGSQVCAVLLGKNVEKEAGRLAAAGADIIYLVEDDMLEHYRPDLYPVLLSRLAAAGSPAVMLFGATAAGRDLAPSVAARLQTGCSADCCDLILDETGALQQVVPAFGGRVMATIVTPRHRPQVATVRPGVFKQRKIAGGRGDIIRPELEIPAGTLKLLACGTTPGTEAQITSARKIVAGGAGIKNEAGWELLRALAGELGGAPAGTRPAVDEGFITEDRMVGQSGHTVRPDLYIAAGISGDIQHMVGVKEARLIIAINNNPAAPIFQQCDFGIVGDYREVLPALLEALKRAGS